MLEEEKAEVATTMTLPAGWQRLEQVAQEDAQVDA